MITVFLLVLVLSLLLAALLFFNLLYDIPSLNYCFYSPPPNIAMWETWVQSLGWEDLLEKEIATHSTTLAWEIPGRLQSMGSQRVGHDRATSLSFFSIVR